MRNFSSGDWKKMIVAATVIEKASCRGQACESILIHGIREEKDDLLQVINNCSGPRSIKRLRKEYERYIENEDYISLLLDKIEEMLEI